MGVELLYSSVKTEVKTFGVRVPVGERSGRESHTRPKGLGALMSWGPEKMLIRCSKESQHPAEWTPASGEERYNVDGHNNGVKILQFLFGLQLPLTRKP